MRIDHVGIATADRAALAATFEALLGTPVAHEETLEDLAVAFLDLEAGSLELLEPIGEGTVARFLEDRGPGLHHVALEVEDVAAALERASEAGIDLVDEAPRPGARGHEVAFLHPSSTGGVLVEFVER